MRPSAAREEAFDAKLTLRQKRRAAYAALRDVAHMPARVKCAVLGWHTLDEALKKEEQGA